MGTCLADPCFACVVPEVQRLCRSIFAHAFPGIQHPYACHHKYGDPTSLNNRILHKTFSTCDQDVISG